MRGLQGKFLRSNPNPMEGEKFTVIRSEFYNGRL